MLFRSAGELAGAGSLAARIKAAAQAYPLMTSTATGAVLTPLITPKPGVQSTGDFLSESGKQALAGALMGYGFGAVSPLAEAAAGKIKNYLGGKINQAEAASLVSDLEQTGTTAKPSTVYYATKNAPQDVASLETAANNFNLSLKQEARNTPFGNLGEIRWAAMDDKNPYNARAKNLLESLNASMGGDSSALRSEEHTSEL